MNLEEEENDSMTSYCPTDDGICTSGSEGRPGDGVSIWLESLSLQGQQISDKRNFFTHLPLFISLSCHICDLIFALNRCARFCPESHERWRRKFRVTVFDQLKVVQQLKVVDQPKAVDHFKGIVADQPKAPSDRASQWLWCIKLWYLTINSSIGSNLHLL